LEPDQDPTPEEFNKTINEAKKQKLELIIAVLTQQICTKKQW